MANSDYTNHARTTLRIAPWICGIAIAAVAVIGIWERPPLNYLVWSAGFGVIWFVLTAIMWRTRNGVIHLFSLMFVILGHMILRKRLMVDDTFLGSLQGMFVTIALLSALLILLRPWLFRFARLEEG